MPFDYFGLIADLYNRTAQFTPSVPLLDLLDLPCNGLLLDAGGGTGRVAEALRHLVGKVIVADPSRKMLNYAVGKGLRTTCAQAEHLPFASCTFDRIIMVDAFHHVFDQHQTISELWRVLSPGGIVVIVEPDIHKFSVKIIAIGEKMLLMRSHFLRAEKIADLFSDVSKEVRVISNKSNVWICIEKVR